MVLNKVPSYGGSLDYPPLTDWDIEHLHSKHAHKPTLVIRISIAVTVVIAILGLLTSAAGGLSFYSPLNFLKMTQQQAFKSIIGGLITSLAIAPLGALGIFIKKKLDDKKEDEKEDKEEQIANNKFNQKYLGGGVEEALTATNYHSMYRYPY